MQSVIKRLGWGSVLSCAAISTSLNAEDKSIVYQAREVLPRIENPDGEAVYITDDLELLENEVLEFDEPAKLHVKDLKLEKGSSLKNEGNDLEIFSETDLDSNRGAIQSSAEYRIEGGADGEDADDGQKAEDALRGGHGGHGGDAPDGVDGGHGSTISIVTPEIKGDLILVSRGGDGGRGGRGGNGGNGGVGFSGADARVLYNFKGLDNYSTDMLIQIGAMIGVPVVGQVLAILQIFNGLQIGDGFDGYDGGRGGNAGHGGNGGNGGDAGDIKVIFGVKDPKARFFGSARGGLGGVGGPAGIPGKGGPGGLGGKAGGLWSRDGEPGKPGASGDVAFAGEAGRPGKAGRVQILQTGDPDWVRCFVRYEVMVDRGMDPVLALDFLERCSK